MNFHDIYTGLLTGAISAGLFVPLDKALYLKMTSKNKKSIFSPKFWSRPYLGLTNSIGSKIISYGIYYSLIDTYNNYFKNIVISGLATSITSSIIIQPLDILRFNKWNNKYPDKINIFKTGLISKLKRDSLFSILYLYSYDYSKKNIDSNINKFLFNISATSIASLISSPFNYTRAIQTKNPEKKTIKILKELFNEINKQKTLNKKFNILINRLLWGWGTVRVSLGVVVGRIIYDYLH